MKISNQTRSECSDLQKQNFHLGRKLRSPSLQARFLSTSARIQDLILWLLSGNETTSSYHTVSVPARPQRVGQRAYRCIEAPRDAAFQHALERDSHLQFWRRVADVEGAPTFRRQPIPAEHFTDRLCEV
jgi:hypothetical protein